MNTNITTTRGRETNCRAVLERESDPIPPRHHTYRDYDLVEALRLREPSATEALVSRYSERAFRLAIRITGNRSDAEEIVQDAFLTVVRKIDTFRGESAFGSWLYRI